jgi:hypothetical protein
MEKPGLLHCIHLKINLCDPQIVRAAQNGSLRSRKNPAVAAVCDRRISEPIASAVTDRHYSPRTGFFTPSELPLSLLGTVKTVWRLSDRRNTTSLPSRIPRSGYFLLHGAELRFVCAAFSWAATPLQEAGRSGQRGERSTRI